MRTIWGSLAVLLSGTGLIWSSSPDYQPDEAPVATSAVEAPTADKAPAAPAKAPAANPAPPPAIPPAVPGITDRQGSGCPCCEPADFCPCPHRFYGSAEYLFWWIKANPVPVPLITATSLANVLTNPL